MKDKLITWLFGMVIERLQAEDLKLWVDMALDLVEDKIKSTPNKYDDLIALPILDLCRKTFDIPDGDK